ncbi:MAG: copper amine oxidase N-terminal domain-containing protein [archaeon]
MRKIMKLISLIMIFILLFSNFVFAESRLNDNEANRIINEIKSLVTDEKMQQDMINNYLGQTSEYIYFNEEINGDLKLATFNKNTKTKESHSRFRGLVAGIIKGEMLAIYVFDYENNDVYSLDKDLLNMNINIRKDVKPVKIQKTNNYYFLSIIDTEGEKTSNKNYYSEITRLWNDKDRRFLDASQIKDTTEFVYNDGYLYYVTQGTDLFFKVGSVEKGKLYRLKENDVWGFHGRDYFEDFIDDNVDKLFVSQEKVYYTKNNSLYHLNSSTPVMTSNKPIFPIDGYAITQEGNRFVIKDLSTNKTYKANTTTRYILKEINDGLLKTSVVGNYNGEKKYWSTDEMFKEFFPELYDATESKNNEESESGETEKDEQTEDRKAQDLEELEKTFEPYSSQLFIGGKYLDVDESLGKSFVDENDRTQIPLRAVTETLGFDVVWKPETPELVKIKGENETISLTIGGDIVTKSNGEQVKMDTKAILINDRTYVPLRFVVEALGYTIDYKLKNYHYINLIKD